MPKRNLQDLFTWQDQKNKNLDTMKNVGDKEITFSPIISKNSMKIMQNVEISANHNGSKKSKKVEERLLGYLKKKSKQNEEQQQQQHQSCDNISTRISASVNRQNSHISHEKKQECTSNNKSERKLLTISKSQNLLHNKSRTIISKSSDMDLSKDFSEFDISEVTCIKQAQDEKNLLTGLKCSTGISKESDMKINTSENLMLSCRYNNQDQLQTTSVYTENPGYANPQKANGKKRKMSENLQKKMRKSSSVIGCYPNIYKDFENLEIDKNLRDIKRGVINGNCSSQELIKNPVINFEFDLDAESFKNNFGFLKSKNEVLDEGVLPTWNHMSNKSVSDNDHGINCGIKSKAPNSILGNRIIDDENSMNRSSPRFSQNRDKESVFGNRAIQKGKQTQDEMCTDRHPFGEITNSKLNCRVSGKPNQAIANPTKSNIKAQNQTPRNKSKTPLKANNFKEVKEEIVIQKFGRNKNRIQQTRHVTKQQPQSNILKPSKENIQIQPKKSHKQIQNQQEK